MKAQAALAVGFRFVGGRRMPEMFRVVGTRRNKTRATLVVGLTEERARSTMLALIETGAFISVEIEREPSDGRTILVPRGHHTG